MITKIIDEQPFQVLTNNFSISPSVTGYELQISADGIDYTTLFTVNANTTRMVTGVAANSYYRLLGNEGEVQVNWLKVCVTGGGGDLSNYYTKSEVDVKVSQLEGEISASTADFYTSAQTEDAIAAATEDFVTSAETEQQISDATPSIVMDTRRKVVFPLNDYVDYVEYAFFDFYVENNEKLPIASITLYDNQGNMLVMPDDNVNDAGEIDITGKTITFTDIAAGSYKMAFNKQLNEDSVSYEETFPVYLNSSNVDETGEQILIHSTEDEEIQPLLYAYNTRWGNEVFITKGIDDNDLNWNFPKDVETLVIDLSDGVDIQITYKATAEELVGEHLIGSEGSVQDALENAGIFDGVGMRSVPNMIADVVNTFSGITSGLSAELSTVERVTSTAINSLRTDVNTISGATANVVTSAYGSGHNVTSIWQGTQDDYNMLTQSGATADATTFYIIKNNPTE